MYKILTSIIAERTYSFLTEHQLLPTEQNESKKEATDVKISY